MTRVHYGMLAGMAGAAFAAWWMRRRRPGSAMQDTARGEVIFSNAPLAE